MDEWAHRIKFRERVAEYRKAKGLSRDEMALELKLSTNTYMGYLYKKTGKPSIEVLQRLAALVGCSVTEFVDDPGAPVAGVDKESFSEASEQERVMMRAMGSDLSRLTDDQRRAAFEAWSAIVRGISGK